MTIYNFIKNIILFLMLCEDPHLLITRPDRVKTEYLKHGHMLSVIIDYLKTIWRLILISPQL